MRGEGTGSGVPRLILDGVGCGVLSDIAREFLDPVDSFCTVHERNGDYAVRLFSSGRWQFLDAIPERDEAARRENAARCSIETGEAVESPHDCGGWVLAVPIRDGMRSSVPLRRATALPKPSPDWLRDACSQPPA
jgi:hypothetical protein